MIEMEDKITEYLGVGGMFNPELMEHEKVRDLLIECRKEIKRLNKYRSLVLFINRDYHELSYEKARWQRDDWKKRANKLIEEDQ